ncbi:hypothetical protein M5D96_001680 [Drosophila gunungcola]|uniref:Uncharacterized protein n=1 Tax=Drosophila gunungcola TaxID=103775 RepID=A0A9P9YYK1_9MUSC|nr:hypothetical protein M5D96_001680 [Drosophila gunungcola]
MAGRKRGRAHCKPIYKHQKEAPITNNGYLNFLMVYKKRFCGISPQDMVRFGARQWNQLSLDEKDLFTNMREPVILTKRPLCPADLLLIKESSEKCKMSPYARQRELKRASQGNKHCNPDRKSSPERQTDSFKECKMSPYARQRQSARTSQGSRKCATKRKRSPKSQGKDRKSLSSNESCAESKQDSNSLGSASAYIHFLRKFRRKNSELSAGDLLKKAVREWSRLDANQRQQFDRPLWVINMG